MRQLTIGICDDERLIHEEIRKICSEYLAELEVKYVFFDSGEEVIEYCSQNREIVNLLFLDVQMDGIDGILLKDKLINSFIIQKIAFVSSHIESVYDSFSKKTIGFIQKPIDKTKIQKILFNTIEELNINQIYTFTNENGNMINIMVEDIVFLKARGSYTYIHTNWDNKYFVIAERMGEIERKLSNEMLARVHKSYIVNLEYIKKFKTAIELRGVEESIPVGRTYLKEAKQKYFDYGKNRVLRRI